MMSLAQSMPDDATPTDDMRALGGDDDDDGDGRR